ncbi:unnamed protein product, partial [Musa acuminata subsp. malaccensis]
FVLCSLWFCFLVANFWGKRGIPAMLTCHGPHVVCDPCSENM